MTAADIERQFATNFYGVAHLMRAVLPVMRKQRSGHIFNISSVAGVVGMKHCSAYGASKFVVEGLSLSVAEEVGLATRAGPCRNVSHCPTFRAYLQRHAIFTLLSLG